MEWFFWTLTSGTFGTGLIGLPFSGFGAGHIMQLNNLNLRFPFAALGYQVGKVTFEFAHLGGMENLSVSGLPPYIGELTAATVPPPYSINVTSIPITGGIKGTVTITGPITEVMMGGQEFALDNVCAYNLTGIDKETTEAKSKPLFYPAEKRFCFYCEA
ncbi:MAG: hypothetical protein ABIJ04_06530 [Bacteroidota bacterium]